MAILQSLGEVDLDNLKIRIISFFINSSGSITPEVHRTLQSVANPQNALNVLIMRGFIGYINYELIKVFQEATESDEMKAKIEIYENMYKRTHLRFSFNTITEVFKRHPELPPSSHIGIPDWLGLSQLHSVSKGNCQKCCTANLYIIIYMYIIYILYVYIYIWLL